MTRATKSTRLDEYNEQVLVRLRGYVERFETELREFVDGLGPQKDEQKLGSRPAAVTHHIEWSEKLVHASCLAYWAGTILDNLPGRMEKDGADEKLSLYRLVLHMAEHLQEALLDNAWRPTSSSWYFNAVSVTKVQAATRMLERLREIEEAYKEGMDRGWQE